MHLNVISLDSVHASLIAGMIAAGAVMESQHLIVTHFERYLTGTHSTGRCVNLYYHTFYISGIQQLNMHENFSLYSKIVIIV